MRKGRGVAAVCLCTACIYMVPIFLDLLRNHRWHRIQSGLHPGVKPPMMVLNSDPKEWLVDERHKILFCKIFKNSMSQWVKMMLEVAGQSSRAEAARPYPAFDPSQRLQEACDKHQSPSPCGLPSGALELLSVDHTWTKLVVLRDPLERLLSAWLDKCAHANAVLSGKRKRPKWCRAAHRTVHATPADFRVWLTLTYDAVRALSPDERWGPRAGQLLSDPHLWPQHRVCGLARRGLGGWRHSISKALYLSSPSYASDAADVLAAAGWDRQLVEAYLPAHLEAESNKDHATQASHKVHEFSSLEVLRMVQWIYAEDYALLRFFNITV